MSNGGADIGQIRPIVATCASSLPVTYRAAKYFNISEIEYDLAVSSGRSDHGVMGLFTHTATVAD